MTVAPCNFDIRAGLHEHLSKILCAVCTTLTLEQCQFLDMLLKGTVMYKELESIIQYSQVSHTKE